MAPDSLAAIRNFLRIDDRLATSGQPTESQLAEIAAAGFVRVINLGLLDPKYCLADEAGSVARLGLRYVHIPVVFGAPTVEDFRAFVAAMDAEPDAPTFVHCAANYRVSAFVALWGQLRGGWSPERADAHARAFWALDDKWIDFLAAVRRELLAAPAR